ncbi:MAG: MBL fold metallo-hydrolase [Desulfuromonadales bacterium]
MSHTPLTCIDLDQPGLPGFRKFISAWLYRGDDFTVLVDPGPLSSIPHLRAELKRQRVERLDYILLTHIHIDHAGGTGALLETFPEAHVICHPDGVRHLVAPEKLWQGSRKVLGDLAETYGEIQPVPEQSIGFEKQIGHTGIRTWLTPGHAPHHCCYQLGDLLFGGEVAGVHYPLAHGIFMRPATPPRFILEVALDSLDRMIALQPRSLVIAHYGLVEPAADYLRIGREQLTLWVRGVAANATIEQDKREEAIFAWLLDHDPHFRNIERLPDDVYDRERIFLGNTLQGMVDYVENLPVEERQRLLD